MTRLDLYDDEGHCRGDIEAEPDDTRESLLRKFRDEYDIEPGKDWLFCLHHSHELARLP